MSLTFFYVLAVVFFLSCSCEEKGDKHDDDCAECVDASDDIEFITFKLLKALQKSNSDLKRNNDDLKKDLSEQRKKSDAQFEELRKKSEAQVDELRKKSDNQIDDLRKKSDAQIDDIRKKSDAQIEELRKKSEEQFNELRKKDDQFDELQKKSDAQEAEIVHLKASIFNQTLSIAEVRTQGSKLSTYCTLLSKNVCGQCSCLDDSTVTKRYYCDCQHLPVKRDCTEFYNDGYRTTGVYRVTMNGLKPFQVYCDHDTNNGGWTVIQRRLDGRTNFYENWSAYKLGFGNVHGEFWIGNDNLYLLTLQAIYPTGSELWIDMEDWEGKNVYAKYSSVVFDNEEKNYAMHLGSYSGDAGDSLGYHSGKAFSTYDRDNDINSGNCARTVRGAWWLGSCLVSNLNGEYLWIDDKQPRDWRGIIWNTYKGSEYSMKKVEMKVRRKTQK